MNFCKGCLHNILECVRDKLVATFLLIIITSALVIMIDALVGVACYIVLLITWAFCVRYTLEVKEDKK